MAPYRGKHRKQTEEQNTGESRPEKGHVAHFVRRFSIPRLLGILVLAFALLLVVSAIGIAVMPLPEAELPSATIIYDINERPVTRLFEENRIPVPFEAMDEDLREAFVAIEDFRFYDHKGIDPISIARTVLANLRAGRIVQGASTITQQLAENLYLSHERLYSIKVQEMFLALKLESRYDKNEILEMYLNTIYLGDGTYGVEAAAQHYFGRSAYDLTLGQAAMIAGLARAPESYRPTRDPQLAMNRRETVLNRMKDLGRITDAEWRAALAEPLLPAGFTPQRTPRRAGYFMDYVMNEIQQTRPELLQQIERAGYRIYTTLDLDMQEQAEAAVDAQLGAIGAENSQRDAEGVLQPQVALVALDPGNGEIRAMVGGRNYSNSPLNRAVKSGSRIGRQPGSAFKPFLYAALFEEGYTTVDRQMSEPTRYPGVEKDPWPTNYGDRPFLWREVTIREALEISENVVAVKWMAQVGPDRAIEMARRLGITSHLGRDLSLVLGSYEASPLEMTAAYAPFANMGWQVKPMSVIRIEDSSGRVVARFHPETRKVIDERVAFLLTDVLKGVIQRGTAANLAPLLDGRPAAGKTGTTEHNQDAWFIGYTPALVTGVWVGNDRPSPLTGVGSSLAGPIWADFTAKALEGRPFVDFPIPRGMVRLRVSALDGLLPGGDEPTVLEWFIEGTEPTQVSPLGQRWYTPEQPPWWEEITDNLPFPLFDIDPSPESDEEEELPRGTEGGRGRRSGGAGGAGSGPGGADESGGMQGQPRPGTSGEEGSNLPPPLRVPDEDEASDMMSPMLPREGERGIKEEGIEGREGSVEGSTPSFLELLREHFPFRRAPMFWERE